MFAYHPNRIIVDHKVKHEVLTTEILKRFSEVPIEFVDSFKWEKTPSAFDPAQNPLTLGKKILHLKYFPGVSIKPCPGLTQGAVCCNYFTIDFMENCPLECSYCILQAFLNKPVITVHANIPEILAQVAARVATNPQQIFRIGTGEHSDSLALDPILGINQQVVPFFAQLPNAILELKTKSANVDHLLDLPHEGHTTISWSVNPETIVNEEEHKTASLNERLEAAAKAAAAGYRIAFHIDPMIAYAEWESGYTDLIERISRAVPHSQIAWISAGSLRFLPKLKAIAQERFPKSQIFFGEFFPSEDGKMRYLRAIRQRMYQKVDFLLQEKLPTVSRYLCMEKANVWSQSMTQHPKTDAELEGIITERLSTPFPWISTHAQ